MDNDALRHELTEVSAMVQEQMRKITFMQEKRAALSATGTSADGMVEVTVDAQRMVTQTVIDENYLSEFEFEDLAPHVTLAARAAVERIGEEAAALMEPLSGPRDAISAMAGIKAMPEFAEVLARARRAMSPHSPDSVRRDDPDFSEDSRFPTVRE